MPRMRSQQYITKCSEQGNDKGITKIAKYSINAVSSTEYFIELEISAEKESDIEVKIETYSRGNSAITEVRVHSGGTLHITPSVRNYSISINTGEIPGALREAYIIIVPQSECYAAVTAIQYSAVRTAKNARTPGARPRVAFILENFPFYSGGRYLSYIIALAIQEIGFNVTVYTDIQKQNIIYMNNSDFKDYPAINIEYTPSLYTLNFQPEDYDIYFGAPADGCIVAHREAVKNKKPFITFIFDVPDFMHEYSIDLRKDWILDPVWDKVAHTYRDADMILCFSHVLVPYIQKFADLGSMDKIKVFHPPVNSRVCDSTSVNGKKYQVLMVNRFAKNKHWDHFFDAISRLKDPTRIVALTTSCREVKELASVYKVDSLLDLHDSVDDAAKFRLMKESMLVVNPSSYEGLSMLAAEAIRSVTPCIAYDFPVLSDIFGNNGMVYAKYINKTDLQNKIEKMLEDKHLYENKIKECRNAEHLFSFDNFADELFNELHAEGIIDRMHAKGSVLIYNHGYKHYSGGVYMVDGFASALAMLGYKVTLLTDSENISSFRMDLPGLERVTSTSFTPPDKHYDLVISIHQHPMIAAAQYAKEHGIPFVPIVWELPNWVNKYVKGWSIGNPAVWEYIKEPLRMSSSILCSAKEAVKYTHEFMPETDSKKFTVIEGIINNHAADSVLSLPDTHRQAKKHVSWVGFSAINKDVKDLIRAVASLKNEWAVDYVTPVHDYQAEKLASELGVELNMVVSPDDIGKFGIIRNSDLLVCTSRFEAGICMSILEALYMKKPVISYDLPLQKELCGNIITSIPADIGELEKAISSIPSAPLEENVMGHKFVKENFTLEAVGKKLASIVPEHQNPGIGIYMGVINEGKFLKYSLEPFLKCSYVKKVVVTEACDKLYKGGSAAGLSIDNTAEIVKSLQEEYPGKIIFLQMGFVDSKSAYQNAGLEELEKHDIDWVIKADGDEVYKLHDLYKLSSIMKYGSSEMIDIPQLEFWKFPYLIATGSLWGYKKRCIFRLKKGSRHGDCNQPPYSSDNVYDASKDGIYIYHYGAMKDRKDILDKLQYYKDRDEHINPEIRVKDTWSDWKEGYPTMWTHTMQKSGTAEFKGSHPVNVRDFVWSESCLK